MTVQTNKGSLCQQQIHVKLEDEVTKDLNAARLISAVGPGSDFMIFLFHDFDLIFS
jgi:hypothetical protein